MAVSNVGQTAIVITALLLPVLTYVIFLQIRQRSASSALPPSTPVTRLYIYPIKSCHGISVPSARLLPTGLDLDRQWMWVTYPDFQFLTIRNLAKMTLIRPSYDSETDTLTVSAPQPGGANGETIQFSVPAHPSPQWLAENTEVVKATVWKTTMPAYCYSTTLTSPFNAFFGREVRMVYKPPVSDSPRALTGNGSKKELGRNASTCFADLMPVLVGSEKSIAELNERLMKADDVSIDVTRFRPNIVVKGDKPWDEDTWKRIKIAPSKSTRSSILSKLGTKLGLQGLDLDVVARCARCHVPNVDTETGEAHKRQPWDTLMKYRRVDPGITFKPCFGMLCVPRGAGGQVDVGMELEITKVTNNHRYISGM